MGNTAEISASPKLRVMFVLAATIMFALWGWSLVPPIENWGNPNEDGFSCVPIFHTTIICGRVGVVNAGKLAVGLSLCRGCVAQIPKCLHRFRAL